ncbi:hypothetical protein PWG15_08905 [Ensifer adhaerens]|uniref:hypothetical protein n=1 Tax=Ensifer adhaerens TaxID=106592 RepID=UPI0023A9992F|nr:hypothetical protein [Ensifer adhaerens]WDZ78586.1 hypothetical protein PWG15_08905 [Ensifer adhaerens]
MSKSPDEMSAEELRLHGDAAQLGQLSILNATVAALVMQAEDKQAIVDSIANCLADLKAAWQNVGDAGSFGEAAMAGARSSADLFLYYAGPPTRHDA